MVQFLDSTIEYRRDFVVFLAYLFTQTLGLVEDLFTKIALRLGSLRVKLRELRVQSLGCVAEFLGYILRQEGQEWVVEKPAAYTKDQTRAEDFIAGKK